MIGAKVFCVAVKCVAIGIVILMEAERRTVMAKKKR